MVYLWRAPENYPEERIGRYERDISPDRFLLIGGEKLDANEFGESVVTFKISKEIMSRYDCLDNSTGVPLVNNRIKAILEDVAPDDIQFFKTKVICADGELEGYYFVNIINAVVGIDHEKSRYKDHGYHLSFTYLTYKPNCMKEHYIARDAEYHGHILVSEKLKTIFDKEHLTGIRLVRPEDYYTDLYGAHPSTPRKEVWYYLNKNYKRYLFEQDLFDEFSQEGEDVAKRIAEQNKDEIFLNYCKKCGNLKMTPKARVCLKCGVAHDPERK